MWDLKAWSLWAGEGAGGCNELGVKVVRRMGSEVVGEGIEDEEAVDEKKGASTDGSEGLACQGTAVRIWVVWPRWSQVGGLGMAKQTARQKARAKVVDKMASMRAERDRRERRLADAAVTVLVSLAERDEAIASCEQAAAVAIQAMLAEQDVGMAEVAGLCDGIEAKELTRLARIVPAGAASHGATESREG